MPREEIIPALRSMLFSRTFAHWQTRILVHVSEEIKFNPTEHLVRCFGVASSWIYRARHLEPVPHRK